MASGKGHGAAAGLRATGGDLAARAIGQAGASG